MSGEQWILGFIWPKNHAWSISAQSYDFRPRLLKLDILDFTVSLIQGVEVEAGLPSCPPDPGEGLKQLAQLTIVRCGPWCS